MAAALVEVPFLPRFNTPIALGAKRATARNKRYGRVGDVLKLPGGTGVLLYQERVTLGFVRDHMWRIEGVDGPAEFQAIWAELHPRVGWREHQKVWLHIWGRYCPDEAPPSVAWEAL
jgi:hypothetical protein